MERITKEFLEEKFGDDVYNAVRYVEDKVYPKSIPHDFKQPLLKHKHTSLEALQYATELQAYEKAKFDFDIKVKERNTEIRLIKVILEDYIKLVADLDSVPEQYRDNVYAHASVDASYTELYYDLCNLVAIFKV